MPKPAEKILHANPEIFVKIVFPAFFEKVSAALLLLETAVIALIWVMIQIKAFLTPLLATFCN